MDERKRKVLRAVVALYGLDGEPVGSGLLAEHFGRAVSSATLRNEMAALTKLGLLEQPHTSAGRVPSAKGYRYYIDNLMDAPTQLSAQDKLHAQAMFREMDFDPERLAQSAARALSDWTGYAVVATTPKSDDIYIAHFEVMQVGRSTAAVLAVTSAGGVRTRTAKLDFCAGGGRMRRNGCGTERKPRLPQRGRRGPGADARRSRSPWRERRGVLPRAQRGLQAFEGGRPRQRLPGRGRKTC